MPLFSIKWQVIGALFGKSNSCRSNIKNFLWTVYHKCLMIRLHLQNRGLRCPTVCDVCTEKDEDWTNVFLGCTKSIRCRQGIGLCNTILHVLHSATSCVANMFAILKIVYVKQKKILGVTFWSEITKCGIMWK